MAPNSRPDAPCDPCVGVRVSVHVCACVLTDASRSVLLPWLKRPLEHLAEFMTLEEVLNF